MSRDIETILERNTPRGKITVEVERAQAPETWLLTLRLNDALQNAQHSDYPQDDAEELANAFA